MKPQTAFELQIANPMIVEAVTLFNRMEGIQQEIARRAYELFEGRGRKDGYAAEDWLRAESELLLPVAIELTESDGRLRVSAAVPGFQEKDIEVSVEPRRLFISGKLEQAITPDQAAGGYIGQRSERFFRALDLPVAIDAEKATATLKDGTLEILLPKAAEIESPEASPEP